MSPKPPAPYKNHYLTAEERQERLVRLAQRYRSCEYTLQELGDEENLTRERIRQLLLVAGVAKEEFRAIMRNRVKLRHERRRFQRLVDLQNGKRCRGFLCDKPATTPRGFCSSSCSANGEDSTPWTKEALLQVLVDFREIEGRNPTLGDMLTLPGVCHTYYYKHFASFPDALVAAGLPENRRRNGYQNEVAQAA